MMICVGWAFRVLVELRMLIASRHRGRDKATITVHGHDICISGKAMASLRLSVSWTYGRVTTLLRETLHGWQGMARGNCTVDMRQSTGIFGSGKYENRLRTCTCYHGTHKRNTHNALNTQLKPSKWKLYANTIGNLKVLSDIGGFPICSISMTKVWCSAEAEMFGLFLA